MTRQIRLATDPTTVNASMLERSITVRAAAEAMSCDHSTIREMLNKGLLRGHRVGVTGRGIRVYEASITEYRQAAATGGQAAAPKPKAVQRPKARGPSARALEAVAFLQSIGAATQDR